MAATTEALYTQNGGTSVSNAWPNVGGPAQNLDLIQVVIEGGKCVLNVDYLGAVHNPASGNTNGTRIGVFESNLAASDTTANYMANAFENLSKQDIIQVIAVGSGNVVYYLDYLGVAHGS